MPLHCVFLHFKQALFLLLESLNRVLGSVFGHGCPHLLGMSFNHALLVLLKPFRLQDFESSLPFVVDARGLMRLLKEVLLLLFEEHLVGDLLLFVQTLAVFLLDHLVEVLIFELDLLVLDFHAHVPNLQIFDLRLFLSFHCLFFPLLHFLAGLRLIGQLRMLLRDLDLTLKTLFVFSKLLDSVLDKLLLHLLLLQQ